MPEPKVDNPGDFSNKVGYDLYLNPWWALNAMASDAKTLCNTMTEVFGKPDLWYQGAFHELLWGPRDLPRTWRPGLCCNVSGSNFKTWFRLWLPWRQSLLLTLPGGLQKDSKPPTHCNVLDTKVELEGDLLQLHAYARAVKNMDARNSVNLSMFEAPIEKNPEESFFGVF